MDIVFEPGSQCYNKLKIPLARYISFKFPNTSSLLQSLTTVIIFKPKVYLGFGIPFFRKGL